MFNKLLLIVATLILFGCSQLPTGSRLSSINPKKDVLIIGDIIFYDGDKKSEKVMSFNGFKMVVKDQGAGAPFDYPAVNSIEGSSRFAFTVKEGKHSIDSIYYKRQWAKKLINVPLNIKFNAVEGEVVNIGLIVVTDRFSSFDFEILENQKQMNKYLKKHIYINPEFKSQPLVLNDDPRMIFIDEDDNDDRDFDDEDYDDDFDEVNYDKFDEVNWEVSI